MLECSTRTFESHRLISSRVHVSGLPFGSGSAGNMSVPQIVQTAAATTAPPNAVLVRRALHFTSQRAYQAPCSESIVSKSQT